MSMMRNQKASDVRGAVMGARVFRSGLLLGALSLAACATPRLDTPATASAEVQREAELQRRYAFEHRRDEGLRVWRISYRLRTAAQDLCGKNVGGSTGIAFWSARDFQDEDQKLARAAYDIHDGLTVLAVAEGSPAEQAGVRAGDRLLDVEGLKIPQKTNRALADMQTRIKKAFEAKRPVAFEFSRGGVRQSFMVPLVPACAYETKIERSDIVNAFADGDQVIVTTGMLNFVRSDEELALVLGHELSHNFLGHLDSRLQNQLVGAGIGLILDVLVVATTGTNPGFYRAGQAVGAQAFSVQFEAEADYAGLYVMRRARYGIEGVADFWRRVALEDPKHIGVATDHPATAARFIALDAAVKEIQTKEAAHQALMPNVKKAAAK